MKRRDFIKNASFTAVGVAAFGSVRLNGSIYEPTVATTSDILGPFYRPGAPMRSNLIPVGVSGDNLTVNGFIYHPDGTTPLSNTLIEAWQCQQDQSYDNTSDDYLFRGAVKTGSDGKYTFRTLMPVPYPNGDIWRPAHIHFRISHPEFQDLITQIYFEGGDHLGGEDYFSSALSSASRILGVVENESDEKEVIFDVVMAKSFPLVDSAYASIEGLYKLENGIVEFERKDDLLFYKLNGQFREGMAYKGCNTFEGALGVNRARFEFLQDGKIKCHITKWDIPGERHRKQEFEGTKFLKYPN